jgi:hypothetical protein
MINVAMLAPILQTLMTTTAEELAKEAEFFKRNSSKYIPAQFLRAVTFGFLKRRDAPLEALAQPLGVSRQTLDQRLERKATADFCRRCLLEAVGHLVADRPALGPLLRRFHGVYLDDCTSAALPDEAADDFPGAKASMKVLLRWEIQGRPLPERERRAEQYARAALAELKRAAESGYFREPANLPRLDKDSDLDFLRGRDDFKQFHAGLKSVK